MILLDHVTLTVTDKPDESGKFVAEIGYQEHSIISSSDRQYAAVKEVMAIVTQEVIKELEAKG